MQSNKHTYGYPKGADARGLWSHFDGKYVKENIKNLEVLK